MFLVTHKTAYEVRISDGSSDVCSSDLSTLSSRPSDRREREPGSTDRPGTKRRNRPRLALAGRSLGRGDGLSGRRRCANAGGPAPRAASKIPRPDTPSCWRLFPAFRGIPRLLRAIRAEPAGTRSDHVGRSGESSVQQRRGFHKIGSAHVYTTATNENLVCP